MDVEQIPRDLFIEHILNLHSLTVMQVSHQVGSPLSCRLLPEGYTLSQVPKRLKRPLAEVLQCHMANLGYVDLRWQSMRRGVSSHPLSHAKVHGQLSEYGTGTTNQLPLTSYEQRHAG